MNTWYIDSDGNVHWPDTLVGTEKYYPVSWAALLAAENDTRTSVDWEVPDGLTEMDTSNDGNIVSVKLRADTAGTHKVVCTIETLEDTATQKFKQEMYLTVK